MIKECSGTRVEFAHRRALAVFTFSFLISVAAFSQNSGASSYKGTPYQDSKYHAGAQKIPGTVNCAFFDRGGEGIAYHDSDAKNNGSGALNPANGT